MTSALQAHELHLGAHHVAGRDVAQHPPPERVALLVLGSRRGEALELGLDFIKQPRMAKLFYFVVHRRSHNHRGIPDLYYRLVHTATFRKKSTSSSLPRTTEIPAVRKSGIRGAIGKAGPIGK